MPRLLTAETMSVGQTHIPHQPHRISAKRRALSHPRGTWIWPKRSYDQPVPILAMYSARAVGVRCLPPFFFPSDYGHHIARRCGVGLVRSFVPEAAPCSVSRPSHYTIQAFVRSIKQLARLFRKRDSLLVALEMEQRPMQHALPSASSALSSPQFLRERLGR